MRWGGDTHTHTHQKREKEIAQTSILPSSGLLPKCLQQLGLGQAKVRSQNFYWDLSCGWQGPTHLGPSSTACTGALAGVWEGSRVTSTQTDTPI